MSMIPRMADSVEPHLIPALYAQHPNGVAAYRYGIDAWPESQLRRFPRHIGIANYWAPGVAKLVRCCDVERGAFTTAQIPEFLDERKAEGHNDALIYCDRSTVPDVLAVVGDREFEWWIATGDNTPWTPRQIAGNIRAVEGVTIDPARIWAIQCYWYGAYDVSLVYAADPHWA